MICHTVHIPYKFGQTIRIKGICDVHLGNTNADIRAFKKWLYENDEDRFVSFGDLMDSIITKDMKRYRKSSDATEGDDIIDESLENLYDLLNPIAKSGRLLNIGSGNHEDEIIKRCGTNPSKRLAKMLNVPFLGLTFLMDIILSEGKSRSRTIKNHFHHGWGAGARTAGAALTKYARSMAAWDAQIYWRGHDHQRDTKAFCRNGIRGTKIVAADQLLGLGGTWLKTYSSTTDPTYAETRGYDPVKLGGISLLVKPTSSFCDMKFEA